MANPYHHAVSSAKKWGGTPESYIFIHEWFDASKAFMGDFRHRALRHHAEGIDECVRWFGDSTGCILNSDGKEVPVRFIAEQHVIEDCGRIPTMQDWFKHIVPQRWMNNPIPLSKVVEDSSGSDS